MEIPIVAVAIRDENEKTFPILRGTKNGSIKAFNTVRNTHYKTFNLSLAEEHTAKLLAEDIDAFTILKIKGNCNLYIDEVSSDKVIPVSCKFSYKAFIKKLYISNEAQAGEVVIITDRLIESGA